jgi:hypothetical protein
MFTKQSVQTIGQDIQEALKAVAEKHGVRIEYRGGSFDADLFKPKIEVKPAQGVDLSKKYKWLNLLPIGTQFQAKGGTVTVFEHDMRRPTYNLVCKDEKGNIRLFNNDEVRQSLIKKGIIKEEPEQPYEPDMSATGS